MAVDGIQFHVDDKEVQAKLGSLQRAAQNPAAIMAAIAPYLVTSTRRHIERETGPEGPWPRLSPRTANKRIGRRQRGYENMLRVRGNLYSSIVSDSGSDYAVVGSNLPYAAIHQTGGVIEMPERSQDIHQNYNAKTDHFDPRFRARNRSNFSRKVKVGAHTITIPARTYLYLDDADRAEIQTIAQDALRDEADLQ